MPVFVVDGKRYKVPLKTLFYGNKSLCEKIMAEKRASSALEPEVTLEQATASRVPNSPTNDACEHTHKLADENNRTWTEREDRLLRDLLALRVPWGRLAVILGNRSVDDVKQRWNYIRRGRRQEVKVLVDGTVSTNSQQSKGTKAEPKPERHVAFADPLITAGDSDDDEDGSSQPPVKRVYYIDKEFSLEDVILLHNIAAKWERDRWLAISTRFNDKTGRKITPDQAKSVVDN